MFQSLLFQAKKLVTMQPETQSTPKTEASVELLKPKHLNPNRIRDHLANERTYLSWMRSGVALMGFGVLIVRIRMLRTPMAPQPPGNGWKLGLAFSVVGLLAVLLSTQHYFVVRDDIEEDTYEPPDRWVIISSLAVLLLGLGVVYYIFAFPAEMAGLAILE